MVSIKSINDLLEKVFKKNYAIDPEEDLFSQEPIEKDKLPNWMRLDRDTYHLVRWLGAFRKRERNLLDVVDYEYNFNGEQSAELVFNLNSFIYWSKVGLLLDNSAFVRAFDGDAWTKNWLEPENVDDRLSSLLAKIYNEYHSYLEDDISNPCTGCKYEYDEDLPYCDSCQYLDSYNRFINKMKHRGNYIASAKFNDLVKELLKNRRIKINLVNTRDKDVANDLLYAVAHYGAVTEEEMNKSGYYPSNMYPEVVVNKKDKVKAVVVKQKPTNKSINFAKALSARFRVPIIYDLFK
ncbi:MAG: hypothetical protein QXG00_07955 [Candidatus Woesearchaeota archaeon]